MRFRLSPTKTTNADEHRGFGVDDWRKRMKKYAFSCENALVWSGENKPKTLVWAKIFCFVFVETKTDTFKNALEWSGP